MSNAVGDRKEQSSERNQEVVIAFVMEAKSVGKVLPILVRIVRYPRSSLDPASFDVQKQSVDFREDLLPRSLDAAHAAIRSLTSGAPSLALESDVGDAAQAPSLSLSSFAVDEMASPAQSMVSNAVRSSSPPAIADPRRPSALPPPPASARRNPTTAGSPADAIVSAEPPKDAPFRRESKSQNGKTADSKASDAKKATSIRDATDADRRRDLSSVAGIDNQSTEPQRNSRKRSRSSLGDSKATVASPRDSACSPERDDCSGTSDGSDGDEGIDDDESEDDRDGESRKKARKSDAKNDGSDRPRDKWRKIRGGKWRKDGKLIVLRARSVEWVFPTSKHLAMRADRRQDLMHGSVSELVKHIDKPIPKGEQFKARTKHKQCEKARNVLNWLIGIYRKTYYAKWFAKNDVESEIALLGQITRRLRPDFPYKLYPMKTLAQAAVNFMSHLPSKAA